MTTPRRELLEEAADLIDGDRNVSYGSPTQNFQNIADMWTIRFAHMLKDDAEFTAVDVADAMVLLKVARNIANTKRDNFADIAGYAACGYEATLEPEEEEKLPGPFDWAKSITINPGPTGINMYADGDIDVDAIRNSVHEAFRRRGYPG